MSTKIGKISLATIILCLVFLAVSSRWNTEDHDRTYPDVFNVSPGLVSDVTDYRGYCLPISNECYTLKGRFLGVGPVEHFMDFVHPEIKPFVEIGDVAQAIIKDKLREVGELPAK